MQLWGLTDPGNLREQNQDSYAMVSFSRDRSLMIVCDGMGGAKSGNVASSLAVDVFTDEVRRCQRPGMTPERGAEVLRGALELANKAVFEQAQVSDDFTGMGTTLSVLWMSDNFVYIGHVGDSRVYLLRDGEFKQMTLDHSLVEQLVREGVLTEEEAQNHPMRNIITRAIGTDESVEVDVVVEERRKGDLWLACSDGLHGLVDDRQMRDALRQYAPEKAADVLLKAALDAGGRDNVTLVIVHDGEEPA